jgi:hypothetical protein
MVMTTLWMYYGYNKFVFEDGTDGRLHFTLAAIVQFYSQLICFSGNILVLGLHSLTVVARDRRRLHPLWQPYLGIAAAILPWVLYSGMLGKGGGISFRDFFDTFGYYTYRINFHILPLLVLPIPFAHFALKNTPIKEWVSSERTLLLVGAILGQLFFLSVFPMVYFRYMLGVLVLLLVLEAYVIGEYIPNRLLQSALLAVVAGTNALNMAALYPFGDINRIRSPIAEFINEISHDYEDKFENIVAFLKENATPDESIAVPTNDFALIYYTDMEVVDGLYEVNYPRIANADWILPESASDIIQFNLIYGLQVPESERHNYKEYELEVWDTPVGASRPDPDFHHGLTAEKKRKIKIYRRIAPAPYASGL